MFDRSELDAFKLFRVCDFEDSNDLELLAFSKADSSPVILSRDKFSDNLVVKPFTRTLPESSFGISSERAFDMFSKDQFLSE